MSLLDTLVVIWPFLYIMAWLLFTRISIRWLRTSTPAPQASHYCPCCGRRF